MGAPGPCCRSNGKSIARLRRRCVMLGNLRFSGHHTGSKRRETRPRTGQGGTHDHNGRFSAQFFFLEDRPSSAVLVTERSPLKTLTRKNWFRPAAMDRGLSHPLSNAKFRGGRCQEGFELTGEFASPNALKRQRSFCSCRPKAAVSRRCVPMACRKNSHLCVERHLASALISAVKQAEEICRGRLPSMGAKRRVVIIDDEARLCRNPDENGQKPGL